MHNKSDGEEERLIEMMENQMTTTVAVTGGTNGSSKGATMKICKQREKKTQIVL